MDIVGSQFYDQNSERAYPLFDEATRLDTTSTFTLPNDLIVDLRIAAPASLDATKWFVSQVAAFGAGLVITIAVDGVANVATATVPLDGFQEFSSYSVTPLPGYPQVGGAIVIGSGLALLAASSSIYTFILAATQILPTVIFPAAPAVSAITFVDQFGVETRLTGAVTLVGGTNASLSVVSQTITVGMSTGVLIEDPCPCTDTGGNKRTSIKSINGVTPDSAGNLVVLPVGCPEISVGTASLTLTDTCAQPCCGTPEIDLLVGQALSIDQHQADLANRVAQVEAGLRQLNNYFNV